MGGKGGEVRTVGYGEREEWAKANLEKVPQKVHERKGNVEELESLDLPYDPAVLAGPHTPNLDVPLLVPPESPI